MKSERVVVLEVKQTEFHWKIVVWCVSVVRSRACKRENSSSSSSSS